MIYIRFFLFAGLLAALCAPAHAQYKLDVKTKLEEKRELAVLKHGVLQRIEDSPVFSETEIGEDYSLWITDEERYTEGDSMIVSVGVYIRTPAMVTTGDPIGSTRVQVKYHRDKTRRYVRDSLKAWNVEEPSYEAFQQLAKTGATATGFFADVASGGFGLGSATVGSLFGRITSELTVQPTPIEVLEGWLIGRRALDAAKRIIENNQG